MGYSNANDLRAAHIGGVDATTSLDSRGVDVLERRTMAPRTRSVVTIGTYPPTKCGIATYTSNLREAIATSRPAWSTKVLRVSEFEGPPPDEFVVGTWVNGDHESMQLAAARLNMFDCVLLQHEYGIFGGDDGQDLLELIDELEVPLIAVLHTALLNPSANQRAVMEHLLNRSEAAVVQSVAARERIERTHLVDRIEVIPHGATANFEGPATVTLPHPAILTWGLLGPGKGIEDGIRAVARLSHEHPAATYVIAGEPHPKEFAAHGDRYRESLIALADSLGVRDRVWLVDGYRDWDALRALVRAADIVMLPYESRDQVSSGVLVEAIASGKPVVSTRFPHAVELLSSGAGVLVDHGDVDALASALGRAIYTPGEKQRMEAAARRVAQPLLWPEVGSAYAQLVEKVVETRSRV